MQQPCNLACQASEGPKRSCQLRDFRAEPLPRVGGRADQEPHAWHGALDAPATPTGARVGGGGGAAWPARLPGRTLAARLFAHRRQQACHLPRTTSGSSAVSRRASLRSRSSCGPMGAPKSTRSSCTTRWLSMAPPPAADIRLAGRSSSRRVSPIAGLLGQDGAAHPRGVRAAEGAECEEARVGAQEDLEANPHQHGQIDRARVAMRRGQLL